MFSALTLVFLVVLATVLLHFEIKKARSERDYYYYFLLTCSYLTSRLITAIRYAVS